MDRKEMRLRIARELHKQMPGCTHDQHGSDCQGLADVVLPLWYEEEAAPALLAEGEFIHFEYLHFDPDDAETGFTNYVEVSHDRRVAADKAAILIRDPKVWAIHIRRYEQPEQGVHLYDETQHLAVAQNKAYAEHKRAETLQKLLGAAVASNHQIQQALDEEERRNAVYDDMGTTLTSEVQAQQPMDEHACKKCGRPERDHMLWALSHLYERGEIVLDYCASVTMRALPQHSHSEHLFVTTAEDGIVPDEAVCRIGECRTTYGSAKATGLTVTSSALAVLPMPTEDED